MFLEVLIIASLSVFSWWLFNRRTARRLMHWQNKFEEEERSLAMIASEIHDHINYKLTLALIRLREIKLPDAREPADLLSQSIDDLQQLSRSRSRQHLMRLELSEAIREECLRCQRLAGIPIEFNLKGEQITMDPHRELILYRLLQEGLQNILKHAGARTIQMSMDFQKEQLLVSLRDDGCGYVENRSGSGLLNMQMRARLIQSQLALNSLPSLGSELVLSTPYHEYRQHTFKHRTGR